MDKTLNIILLIVALFLLFMSAFFSAAETAYSSLSKMAIEKNFKSKTRTDKLIQKHYKSFGWTLTTILIGNNIVNVGISSLTTYLLSQLITDGGAMITIASIGIVTPIIVIFGEVFPKLLAKKYPYSYLRKIVYVMQFFNILFFPITFPLAKLEFNSKVTNTESELKDILKLAYREKVLENNEATLASNALDLDSTKVSEVMVRRKNITSISSKAFVGDAISTFRSSTRSRLPVADENGKLIGILLSKSILGINESEPIDHYIIKAPKVSKNFVLIKALEKMRKSKVHMAFVTDSSKANEVIGLVTLEDIFEELVGEIYDEMDTTPGVHQIGLHKWFVNGNTKMTEIGKELDFNEFEKTTVIDLNEFTSKKIKRNMILGKKYLYKNKFWFVLMELREDGTKVYEILEKVS